MTRLGAREAIMANPDLSFGARVLYHILDSHAGLKGHCWPKQETVAEKLGIDPRNMRVLQGELVAAGFVTVKRRRHDTNVCTLAWSLTNPQSADTSELDLDRMETSDLTESSSDANIRSERMQTSDLISIENQINEPVLTTAAFPCTVEAMADLGVFDAAVVQTLVKECKEQTPTATDPEIAECIRTIAGPLVQKKTSIRSPSGVVLATLARSMPVLLPMVRKRIEDRRRAEEAEAHRIRDLEARTRELEIEWEARKCA